MCVCVCVDLTFDLYDSEEEGNFPLFLEAKRRYMHMGVAWHVALLAFSRDEGAETVVVVKVSEVWPATHSNKSGRGQKQTRIKPTEMSSFFN